MSVSRLVVAGELVEELAGVAVGGRPVLATVDPDAAAAGLPAVLIVPPALDFTAHEPISTWSLQLLTSSTTSGLDAWRELDQLLDAVEARLPIESASPSVYALSPDAPAVPCYTVTLTTQGHAT